MSPKKSTELVPLMLRLRESLRKKLERAAKSERLSLNAEVTRRLENTFREDEENERQWKWIKEQEKHVEEEQRQFWEERAREDAEEEAARRDSRVLKALVAGDENARLLRLMILGLGNNPEWAATPESRKALADKVHHFLVSTDFNKGDAR